MDSLDSIAFLEKKWLRADSEQDELHDANNPEFAGTRLSSLTGFKQFNASKPDYASQGILSCLHELQETVCDLTGFEALSFAALTNAQAVFACLAMVRKFHLRKKQTRNDLLCLPGVSVDVVRVAQAMHYEITSADMNQLQQDFNENLAAIVIPLNLLQGNLISAQQIKLLKSVNVLVYVDGQEQGLIPHHTLMGDLGVDLMHLDLGQLCHVYPGTGVVLSNTALKDYLPTPRIAKTEGKYRWTNLNKHPLSIGPISATTANIEALLRCYVAFKLQGSDRLQQQAVKEMVYMASLIKALNYQVYFEGYGCMPVSTVLRLQIDHALDLNDKLQPLLQPGQALDMSIQIRENEDKHLLELTLRGLYRLQIEDLKWVSQLLLDVGAKMKIPGLKREDY